MTRRPRASERSRIVRASRAGIAVVALLAVAVAAAQVALSDAVSRRLEQAIAEAPGVTGRMADVSVCLPCGSYTVRELVLHSESESGEAAPLLAARELEVGVRLGALLAGRRAGEVVLRTPQLHVDAGRETQGARTALDVPWAKVGQRLLPWPIERVAVHDGALRLHHQGFETPVVWKFDAIEGEARQLGAGAPAPPQLEAHGDAFGSGRFEVAVDFAKSDAGGFTLTGTFREVPLDALRELIRQRVGIGVESGRLRAELRIEGHPSGWDGTIDCTLAELDIFAPDDLSGNPLHALTDALAGGVTALASLGREGPLHVRLDVERRLGRDDAVDPWRSLTLLVREALLAPFTFPLDALAAAAERVVPGEDAPDEDTGDADTPDQDPPEAGGQE